VGELTDAQKDHLAAEVFAKSGVPLSKDDPIFALVETIKAGQVSQPDRLLESLDESAVALSAAADRLLKRSTDLEAMVDAYIQSRLEAANATMDIEVKRMTSLAQEELRAFTLNLGGELGKSLNTSLEDACIKPIREALDVIPQRSWLESVWTLAACLAIGFLVGFIYFNGTIRDTLEYQLQEVTAKLPSPSPAPKK
jgi:hypothetical protein